MARYRLDDRGILTIVDDRDGVLIPLARAARAASIILLCLVAAASVWLFLSFYLPCEDSNAALRLCGERLSGLSPWGLPGGQLESAPFLEEAGDAAGALNRQAASMGEILSGMAEKCWELFQRIDEAVRAHL